MNISTKQLLLIFVPILLAVSGFFYVQYIQYEPLYPKNTSGPIEIDKIPTFPNDIVFGNKKADKTIVAFEDLACEGCKIQQKIFDKLLQKHSDRIKIVWKGLPVKKVPVSSELAHRYAFCLKKQGKFRKFMDLAFANSDNLSKAILKTITDRIDVNKKRLNQCLNSRKPDKYIEKTKQLARLLNIKSVPTVFVNGEEVKPPRSVSGWENILNINE